MGRLLGGGFSRLTKKMMTPCTGKGTSPLGARCVTHSLYGPPPLSIRLDAILVFPSKRTLGFFPPPRKAVLKRRIERQMRGSSGAQGTPSLNLGSDSQLLDATTLRHIRLLNSFAIKVGHLPYGKAWRGCGSASNGNSGRSWTQKHHF